MSKNAPSARNTRSRFTQEAAALAAVASVTKADAHQWEHKNTSPCPTNSNLMKLPMQS